MAFFYMLPIFLWFGYFAYKYADCRKSYSRLPTLMELWKHKVEDGKAHRNARAVKIGALFFSVFALPVSFIDHGMTTERDFSATMRIAFLFLLAVNVLTRYVLYKEKKLDDKEFSYQYGWYFSAAVHEMVYAFRRVGFFVKGADYISTTMNLSSISIIALVVYWFLAIFQ